MIRGQYSDELKQSHVSPTRALAYLFHIFVTVDALPISLAMNVGIWPNQRNKLVRNIFHTIFKCVTTLVQYY